MSVVVLPSVKKDVRPVHEAVAELNDIAVARGKKRHITTAIVEMKRAIAVLPNSRELWNNLGTFLWNARQYEEALACIDRALKLDGTFFKAFYNRALILEDTGQYDEAEKHFALSLENCTTDEKYNLNWCRSMMRLSRGDYANAWEGYEDRIPFSRTPGASNRYPIFPAPYWQGEEIAGKRVFCCVEQGLGDNILFSRFLPWLHCAVGTKGKVYLCCSHEMMVLLWDFYLSGVVEFVPEGVPIPSCDFSVVVGSLPWHSRCTLETLPKDPGLIRKRADVQMKIGPAEVPKPLGPNGYKVGIVWTGNPEQERNTERTIPLELLLPLAEHPNVALRAAGIPWARRDTTPRRQRSDLRSRWPTGKARADRCRHRIAANGSGHHLLHIDRTSVRRARCPCLGGAVQKSILGVDARAKRLALVSIAQALSADGSR